MRKLLSLALFLISVSVYSQIALPVTWDEGAIDYTTTSFGGTTNSTPTVVDPSDASNTVLRILKPAGSQTWAGTTIGKDFAPKINDGGFPTNIPFTAGNTTITVRVRSNLPAGTTMMVKVEDKFNGGIFSERTAVTTAAAGQWQNMTFNMAAPTGGSFNLANNYGKLSFFPNFGSGGDNSHEFFVDNIALGLPPVISSFAPTSETTGNTVTISGNNFTGATAVSFGGSPAASFTVVNDNTITAVIGVGSSGAVKVVTPVSSETLAGFTFIPPATAPTITSFTPTSGASGATITITGTNFSTATAVNFGGDAAASFTIVNSTTITAIVDAGASGSVAVTNNDGFATLAGFTYIPPAPTISSFTPTGSGASGTVTITGTNFIDITGVTFGGTAASAFTVVNPTTITATVGSGASGSVAVTNPGGTGSLAGFTFKSPISLPITFNSSSVDYTTTDFGGASSALDVDPANASNPVLRISKVAGAQTWGGTTLGKDFAPKVNNGGLTAPIPFTNESKIITARVYTSLPPGVTVRCKVENTANGGISAEVDAFTTVQNGWSTLFWNLTGVNLANSYEKISFFPNFNTGGASGPFYLDDVAYYPAPTITSFTPTSATTGNTVTITGTNFTGATAVSFGGVAATSFTVVNSTTITAVVALGASGSVSVTRGGVGTLAGFTFTAPPTGATVTSFTPTSAGETGVVTITGTNFTTATAVSFGGTAAASFNIVDDNTITAVLGAGASGSVSVTNPSGIGSLAGFSYIPKAPIAMPINWDSPITVDYTTSDFGSNVSSQDVDPTNPSNKVLKIVKGVGAFTWAGTTLGKVGVNNGGFATPLPFTPANRFLTARVYSTRPVGTIIMLKIEQGTAPAQNSEKAVATTVQNAWETLVFDFGAHTGGNPLNYSGVDYDKLSVFCNFGQVGTASANTFYIDDIKFVPGPAISSFTPTSAATGTTVTINGSNLSEVTAVSFGGTPAASFSIVSNNEITAVVAAGTSGSVSVVNAVGSSSLAGFDYIAPLGAPIITSFSPSSSIVGGLVTLSGSNFTSATAVKFGGTNAASYTIVNSSTIKAIVGPGSTGSVAVTNSFGTGTKAGFTFLKKRIALPVVWDDFATVDYSSGDFCGLASALATDPADAANTVMKLTKTTVSAACAGTVFGNNSMLTPIPFSLGNTTISVRFYSPVAGLPVLLKLEGPGAPIEKLMTATTTGWQIMEFDFAASANLSDVYNKLVFFPGFNLIAGATQVSYVDNIIFGSFASNTWNGTTSSDFATGSNWSLGFPPTDCSMNATISGWKPNQPSVTSGAVSLGSVTFTSGGNITVSPGATLSICGNISANGYVSSQGTVVMAGSSAQTINGVHNLKDLTINKPASSGNVTIDGRVNVSGVVTLSNANSNLVVGSTGNLTLLSNASGTASIAAIPAGASVNGDVTIQRYLNGSGDGWFLLGGSVQGAPFSQWSDDLYMAAGTSLGGTQGVQNLGIQHSTIFGYDEAGHNVSLDTVQKSGWRVPVSGDDLAAGKGFRVYLTEYNTASRTIDNVGTIHQGNFTFPSITRNEFPDCQPNVSAATIACTENNRGWNLLSNPYPSSINWDAASGWTKPPGMLNGFWRWNSAVGGYGLYTGGTYVGAAPAPANPALIPSGQGFFVKLQTGSSASLSMTEAVKVNTQATMLRTASATPSALRMELRSANNSVYSFIGELRFADGASDGLDAEQDAPVMPSSGYYFTMPVGNEDMILNTMASLNETKIIPLNIRKMGVNGSFVFTFSGISSFPAQTSLFVRDNVNGTIQDLRMQPIYSFELTSIESGSGRFELIVSPEIVTATEISNQSFGLRVYPNPAAGSFFVEIPGVSESSARVVITDVVGKVVLDKSYGFETGKTLISSSIAAGIYTVKLTAGGRSFTRRISVQ
jgi:hypothetical protein